MGKTALATLSGGLDSTTALRMAIEAGWDIRTAVSFNYGQRHKTELGYAHATCQQLGIKHIIIDLNKAGVTEAIAASGSSLVSDNPVPDGHYAQENMVQTIVPNRNMMMISIAAAIAIAEGSESVLAATHAGDHFIYPDCRPEFMSPLAVALMAGNDGTGFQGLVLPYLTKSKTDIAYDALRLGYPLSSTWSCYKGGLTHCGRCGTCVERLEAIHDACKQLDAIGIAYEGDDTEYEDTEYWMQAVAEDEIRRMEAENAN
jgi:7-cyano-7-deazaguanine synthase